MEANKPKKKRVLTVKEYEVNVDMCWSMNYTVKAKTEGEAKRKAWERFKRNPPRKCFDLMADRK